MFTYDVLCVGSAVVDTFFTVDQRVSSVKMGDKVLVSSVEKHSGGSATNAGAALKKLGVKTRILTKMGEDHDAEFINKELQKYSLQNICLHNSKRNTDTAVIISSTKERDRVIYVHKGASEDLTIYDFVKKQLKARWIYMGSLMETSLKTGKKLVKYAHGKKTKILFNPSLYLAKKGVPYLRPILKATEILVLNKKEAQTLVNGTTNSSDTLVKKLHKLGPQTVVITNGAKKMVAYHEGQVYSLLPPDVKVVHTAGAGDAFTAGLLAGLIKKYSFEDALQLGVVNSLSVVQHIGTKHKLLTEKEAQQKIQRYKIKVHKHVR
ncbi:carbohydrate kinase family protein [Candidatus Woesearchaeota archaeon]|jgi:sugar/nucleoside kinase (ribokinase family)|nr:carbohydrate kinase family protein [Candidatus Woesearchaeota archaeon]MBT5396748.1 carbohydrate kinase family protein [Candidatus Woesearchaeota archaeon]MBT5924708.1 carbohydrate kinase family protein [Candidatus Woesearchaeota archaeon]MBT6367636.1 carbohydrate kinase family protein [Candidatus Woesearchaeota archaeon]MBT7762964.1 carbohydrate kinase family protein [Candidatus Woesearchaeota archaeon]